MIEALRGLASALANQLTRARHVLSAYDPTGARTMMQLTGMANEAFQGIELLLPYGMSAIPVGNTADALILQVNGHRDHKVALAADDPALRIPGLAAGEFGFRDARGQQVVFRGDRLEVTSPLKLVVNTTGDCDLTVAQGNLNVTVSQGNAALAAPAGAISLTAPTGRITANGNVLG